MSVRTIAKGGFSVQMEGLEEIEAALGMMKDKSNMVLRTAINNVAKRTNKSLINEDKKDYMYKSKSDISKASKVGRKATTGKLTAEIDVVSRIGTLYEYQVTPRRVAVPKGMPYNPPKSYSGRALRSASKKLLKLLQGAGGTGGKDKYKAFVVQYPNTEHIDIAQRVPGTHMKDKPKKEQIRNLPSSSIPKMSEMSYRRYDQAEMEGLLMNSIIEQINRYLG